MLRLARLAKLLRVARLKRLVKKYAYDLPGLGASAALTSTLFVAIFVTHMITCVWFLIGDHSHGWVAYKWPRPPDPCPDPSSPLAAGMACEPNADVAERYLHTFWWSISILLASEMITDITPRLVGEVIFTIVCQIFSAVLFGLIIGTVGQLLLSSKLLEEKVDKQLAELREFMAAKRIPRSLRRRIRDFMETLFRSKTG